MRIGIIGAGFTGLSAGIHLQEKGCSVTIFEKDEKAGGLAVGFRRLNWEWMLEKHYHHIFTSDKVIQKLAAKVGVPFDFYRPNTSALIGNNYYQIDSPLNLLTFSKLNLVERLRMGAVLGYLKYLADWRKLEDKTAHSWLETMMGKRGYETIWQPLLAGKFGTYSHDISLAWFWARIKARTPKLGYPRKGFQYLANSMVEYLEQKGGRVLFHTTVETVNSSNRKIFIRYWQGLKREEEFDVAIITLPTFFLGKILPQLPSLYLKTTRRLQGLAALNLVLELKEKFLPHKIYWLNICSSDFPFLAVVEHTNLIDRSHYGGSHLIYVGKYLSADSKLFFYSDREILDYYHPYLQKIKPNYQSALISYQVFKTNFAQPIIPVNYSRLLLPLKTPVSRVYLANMQQVYPWDRGTNYAVELGEKVAEEIINSL